MVPPASRKLEGAPPAGAATGAGEPDIGTGRPVTDRGTGQPDPGTGQPDPGTGQPDRGTGWLSADLQSAFAAMVEGADLSAPDVSGTVALVVPATVGRPRRPRGAAAATSASSSAEVPARATLDIDAGRIVRCTPGAEASDALATLTLPAADARSLLEGASEPSVLFMQGRLKTDGDMAAVLALLRATAGDGYGHARATLAGSSNH